MAESYIISIDQSTQGTKALLFDQEGVLLQRNDLPHRQIVNEKGWVSHDPEEIYRNAVQVVKNLVKDSGISKGCVKGIGISNQRETSLIWEKETGKALANAVVWQCARAADICRRVEQTGAAEKIRTKTGLALSPYFPASKLAWLKENVEGAKDLAEKICRRVEQTGAAEKIRTKTGLALSPYFPASKLAWLKENVEGAKDLAEKHELCFGTIDTWLVYKMTHGVSYKTDYSNASRTQLFDIFEKTWDEEICQLLRKPGMKKFVSYLDWMHRILQRCVTQTAALERQIWKDFLKARFQSTVYWEILMVHCLDRDVWKKE